MAKAGFGWQQVLFCILVAFPLAILWRQIVVPLILLAKKNAPQDPEELLALVNYLGIPTSWLDAYMKKIEWLLLYVAGLDTWLLIILAVTFICGVEVCCNVPSAARKKEYSTGDAELDRQMAEIEQSLDELNAELDQMQQEEADETPPGSKKGTPVEKLRKRKNVKRATDGN